MRSQKYLLTLFGVALVLVMTLGTIPSSMAIQKWTSRDTVSEYGATVEVTGQGPIYVISGVEWNLTVYVRVVELNQSAPTYPIGINITEVCVRVFIVQETHHVDSCFGLPDQFVFLTEQELWIYNASLDWWIDLGHFSDNFQATVRFNVVWDVVSSFGISQRVEYWSNSSTIQYHYTATPPTTPYFIPIPGFPLEVVLLTLILTIGVFVYQRRRNRCRKYHRCHNETPRRMRIQREDRIRVT